LLRCLHVKHGEEQHLRGNSNLNVETTPFVHVKGEIKQGSRSGLGLGSDAYKEYVIKNTKLKKRRNLHLNVEAAPLAHIKVEIK
jgi:hypothetical protein